MRRPALTKTPQISRQAAALRRAFDRSFAEPNRPPLAKTTDLLAIRLGGDPWAVPLADIAGLHSGKRITPLPGGPSSLLGIAGFRGNVVAVYDLPALIGQAPLAAPRWLLVAAERRVAFAFGELDGHVRVETKQLLPLGPEGGAAWAKGFVLTEEQHRPLLHLPALLAGIAQRSKTPEGSDL